MKSPEVKDCYWYVTEVVMCCPPGWSWTWNKWTFTIRMVCYGI